MKCMNPVVIYWDNKNEKYSYHKPKLGFTDYDKSIVVSCGRCPACRQEWRTHLARRMVYELDNYNLNERCFITLTVDEDHIDEVFPNGSLDHAYFQKFMKRLRDRLDYHDIKHKPLKYLVCGEYGAHNTHRPHFHLILLGWQPHDMVPKQFKSKKGYQAYTSEFLSKVWKAGRIEVGIVTEHTAPYMVKYIVKHSEEKKKKTVLVDDEMDFIDLDTGEIKTIKGKVEVKKHCFKNLAPKRDKKGKYILNERGEYIYEVVEVRAPYIVYPKKILGIDYFLKNYKQILRNGFIFDSKGNKHGIPKSFLNYCKKHEENIDLHECYLQYLDRLQVLFEEEKKYLISLGYVTFADRVLYYREQARIRREQYKSFKDTYR